MKKIIALAVVGLFVSACDFDSRNDEAAASTVTKAMVTGRNANTDIANGGTMNGPWLEEGAAANSLVGTPSRGSFGRMVVATTDGLLDGSSIEGTDPTTCGAQVPSTCCQQAGNWLTVTGTFGALPAGGQWYTCYYPSSATTDDGASIYIFYATQAPGVATASQPIRSGVLTAGEYNLSGTVKSKNGTDFPINIAMSIGEVILTSADADDEIPPGATNEFTADLVNRTSAETTFALSAVDAATGAPVTGAAAGAIGPKTEVDADTATVTYTAPATVPADGILATVTATADRLTGTYTILVIAP